MKRNILIGASIAILLIALAVTIVSNGTYSTNTVGISCGEVSDTTMYVGNTKKITVTIKDTDNNDITSDYSDASFGWEIENTSIASITENIAGNNFNEINVKGIKEGSTTLKISITDGENIINGTCAINISSRTYKIVPSTELSTNEKGNYVLRYGNETTLNITGINENYNVAWSIGQGSDIATIDSQTGELIASGIGEVEVIATICENESQDNCDESTITVDVTPNVKNIIVKADGTEIAPTNATFDPTKYDEAYLYEFGSDTEETINKIQINVELNNAKSNVKICKDKEGTDCLEPTANGNTLSVEIDAPDRGESILIDIIDKKEEDSTQVGKENIYILQLANKQSIEPTPEPNPDVDPTKDNLLSILTSNETNINTYTIDNTTGVWVHTASYPNNVDKVTIYYKLINDNYTCKYLTGEKEQECSNSEGSFSLNIIEGNNPVAITIYKDGKIEQTHSIIISREIGTEPSPEEPSEEPGSNTEENSGTHVDLTNPTTGSIPKFIISLIMIVSLIATLFLYKKNMEKL